MKFKKLIAICLCALGASALAFTACGDDKEDEVKDEVTKYVLGMQSSADSAISVDAEVTLTDGGVVVYTFTRHMEIDTEMRTATISDTTTVLAENFEEKTTTSTTAEQDVTGKTIIGLNLSKELVKSFEIKDGDLTCTISKDKISEVFTTTVSASSDVTVSVDFENGKLTKAEYSYTNTSSRTVSVTVTYGY